MRLLTVMFSDSPGMPGRRQQIPLTTRRIWTPAWEALYSASMTSLSTSALILAQTVAGRPAPACSISSSMSWIRVSRRWNGATTNLSRLPGWPYPVVKLKTRAASRHSFGSQVKYERSV